MWYKYLSHGNIVDIVTIAAMACNFSDYCLGMCDCTDCPGGKENEFPESSALSREQCFTEFVSDDKLKLADLAKGFVPDNTERNTQWALKNFDLWRKARNECRSVGPKTPF